MKSSYDCGEFVLQCAEDIDTEFTALAGNFDRLTIFTPHPCTFKQSETLNFKSSQIWQKDILCLLCQCVIHFAQISWYWIYLAGSKSLLSLFDPFFRIVLFSKHKFSLLPCETFKTKIKILYGKNIKTLVGSYPTFIELIAKCNST